MSPFTQSTHILHKLPPHSLAPTHHHHTTPQHVIIMGKGLSNLVDLIRPLRAKYLRPMKIIIIIYPVEIPFEVWQRIAMYDGIYIVRGSPLEGRKAAFLLYFLL